MCMEKINFTTTSISTLAYWSINVRVHWTLISAIVCRCEIYCIYEGHKFSPKSWSHLQILCAIMLTRNNFHIDDPKFWIDLRSSRVSGPWNSVHLYWHTDFGERKKNCNYYDYNIRIHCTKFCRPANSRRGLIRWSFNTKTVLEHKGSVFLSVEIWRSMKFWKSFTTIFFSNSWLRNNKLGLSKEMMTTWSSSVSST